MVSPQETFSVSQIPFYKISFFLDSESQLALRNISDAIDCWMEFIRIDPMHLIDDQPYNSIIFNSAHSNDCLQKSLEMTESLQKIAHHYFQETRFGPNQYRLLDFQNQFHHGCDQLIKLLKATKIHLHFNYCLCNTFNTC